MAGARDFDSFGEMPARTVVFSLGSNLGDRLEYLSGAARALRATPGVQVSGVSSVYETSPVGLLDQPDFLNIVIAVTSRLPAQILLERALAIEDAFDRVRVIPGGPRTVDVDVIAAGEETISTPTLTVPHPRAAQRAFVLQPWSEIDPQGVLVGHGPIVALLAGLDATGVRRRDDLRLDW